MTLKKKYSSVPEDLHYMFATEFICNRATECKFKNYGDIAQLGSRIKNARNGIFYRKRRSFLIEFMKRERVNEIRKRVPEATRMCCKTSPAHDHQYKQQAVKRLFFLNQALKRVRMLYF